MPGSTKHPTAIDSHTGGDPYGFAEAVDVWRTLLTADAPAGSTTLSVATTSGLPSRGEIILADPAGVVTSEVVTYTSKTSTSLVGVSPTSREWLIGTWVHTGPTARSHNDLAAAIVAVEAKQGQSIAVPADVPAADRLLGSNAAGKSGWIQLLIGMVPDSLLTAAKLATDSVTSAKIAADAVTTVKILNANVTAAKLAVGAAVGNLVDNTVNGAKLVDATVAAAKLAAGAALGNIANGSIGTALLAANAITKVANAFNATTVSISSTSYGDVITVTFTTSGGDVIVFFNSAIFIGSGTPTSLIVGVRADAGADAEITYRAVTSSVTGIQGWGYITGLAAGSHTFALRAKNTAAGTTSMQDNNILALELKK